MHLKVDLHACTAQTMVLQSLVMNEIDPRLRVRDNEDALVQSKASATEKLLSQKAACLYRNIRFCGRSCVSPNSSQECLLYFAGQQTVILRILNKLHKQVHKRIGLASLHMLLPADFVDLVGDFGEIF